MSLRHNKNLPTEVRFDLAYEVDSNGCWNWKGAIQSKGYGMFKPNGVLMLAHNYSYERFKGSRDGLYVLHSCDNRKCVNPDHLWLGTPKDNTRDMEHKGRGKLFRRKITDDVREQVRSCYNKGNVTYTDLSKEFGISRTELCRIVNNKLGE